MNGTSQILRTDCMFTWRWAEKHSRMTGLWWVLDKCWEMLLLKHSSWLSSINMRHSEKPVWKPTYTSISWYTKPRARNQKDWARNEAIFFGFLWHSSRSSATHIIYSYLHLRQPLLKEKIFLAADGLENCQCMIKYWVRHANVDNVTMWLKNSMEINSYKMNKFHSMNIQWNFIINFGFQWFK